ncbi:MAG: hypothetical protein HQL80_05615 [Magnetococcales bacterium]|nr:hypothetical protein [Magnetococcales bacterium]
MAAPWNRKHLLIPSQPRSEPYTSHPRRIKQPVYSGPADRAGHASVLKNALETAHQEALSARESAEISVTGAEAGITVEFESPAGFDLKLESLENKTKRIELLNVRYQSTQDDQQVQLATVFIPDGSLKHFFDRFEEYAEKTTDKGKPCHKDL